MDIFYLKKILRFFRIALILFFVFLFLFLFYKDFVPRGKLVVINDFQKKSQLISDFYPDVRLKKIKQDEQGNFYQTIFIDPVYFEINSPRVFEKARVIIKYKNKNQSLFRVGVKKGEENWIFNFKTLEFQKFDELSWHKIQGGGLILFQKHKRYESIKDFLFNPPKDGRIAQFDYKLEITNPGDYLLAVLNPKTDLNHVSYIITQYTPPKVENDKKIVQVEFDIDRSNFPKGKLVFMLSAPEMDVNKNEIDIYEIQVALERKPLRLGNVKKQAKEYIRDIVINF